MPEVFDLLARLGAPGCLIAWMAVAASALWLWERYERTRTSVLIERERRARIKRRSGREDEATGTH
ncbi:MAG: hypothetical protein QOE69_1058 [Thermoleophilaceae bacterium]|jgi:hypothetical protein|nr:hypothetical protein [Thermoleophilaceae bacterium]